ncbi:MAG TPA: DUF4412 domain-containing protein [Gemmatimonadales bacterium]|nr:DUF4412 domain-containing protein [Gemmatimonadales bacterium]
MGSRMVAPALLGVSLLATPSAGLPAQTFEGTVRLRVRELVGEVQAYLKAENVRMELMTPMGAVSVIANSASGPVYLVIPASRVVMVVTPPAQPADLAAAELTETGREDQVAGHRCEVFRSRDPGGGPVLDLCLASGLGTIGAGAGALFDNPLGPVGLGPPGRSQGAAWVAELARRRVFPLRASDTTGTPRWEVTRLDRQPVADTLFSPPAGFQRMELPGRRPAGSGP